MLIITLSNYHFYAVNFTNSRRLQEHQMAIMRVKFQFQKVIIRINMISTSSSLTIKGYPDKHY